jgi:hypothetical protein
MRLAVKKRVWNGNPPPPAPIGNGYALKHGFQPLKAAVNKLGARAIDKRTALGKSLARWREDLVADLGGLDNISTQQSTLIDLTVKSKLLLDSIDAWLLTQPSLINKRKRSLIPVVLQRQTLADGLARYLAQLGLERRRKVKTLHDILNEDQNEHADANGKDTKLDLF